jgi:hypothetical protein
MRHFELAWVDGDWAPGCGGRQLTGSYVVDWIWEARGSLRRLGVASCGWRSRGRRREAASWLCRRGLGGGRVRRRRLVCVRPAARGRHRVPATLRAAAMAAWRPRFRRCEEVRVWSRGPGVEGGQRSKGRAGARRRAGGATALVGEHWSATALLVTSGGRRPPLHFFLALSEIYFHFFWYALPQYSHLSTYRWAWAVKNRVSSCLDDHLLKL